MWGDHNSTQIPYSNWEHPEPFDQQRLIHDHHQDHDSINVSGEGSSNNLNLHLHPQGGSPIGLTLRKSNSLINLVEMTLSHEREQKKVEKLKASNFPALLLQIGSWKRISRNEGDLVAKLYYAKRKLVWEFLDGPLKSKIEIQWSEISAIKAFICEGQHGRLEIELNQPPQFGQEINPQPRKHTQWKQTTDFTGGQASICRRHSVIFPPRVLDKQYEKLLQCDNRLFNLSQQPFPVDNYPFFYHNPNHCIDYSNTNIHHQPLAHFHGDPIPNSLTSVITFPYWNEESRRHTKKNQERENDNFEGIPEIPIGGQDHFLQCNVQKSWIPTHEEIDPMGYESTGIGGVDQLPVNSGVGIQEPNSRVGVPYLYQLPLEHGMNDVGSLYRNQHVYPNWI